MFVVAFNSGYVCFRLVVCDCVSVCGFPRRAWSIISHTAYMLHGIRWHDMRRIGIYLFSANARGIVSAFFAFIARVAAKEERVSETSRSTDCQKEEISQRKSEWKERDSDRDRKNETETLQ